MMRVFLVAVERPEGRRWHVSLDPSLRADAFFFAVRDPSARLWRTAWPLPLGRALAEAARRNGADGIGRPRGLSFAGRRTAEEPVLVPVEAAGAGENGGFTACLHAPHGSLPDKLAAAMEGRALLAEEFESLVQAAGGMDGPGGTDELDGRPAAGGRDWRFWAQWGVLHGSFTLRAGVAVNRRFGRFGRERAACLRCGADERWMRRTACASCGETCPYCERCLTMGRARACTPLIAGAAAGGRERLSPGVSGRGLADRMAAPRDSGTRAASRGTAESGGQPGRSGEGAEPAESAVSAALAAVGGLTLSPAQAAAAREGVRFVLAARPGAPGAAVRPFLIWAVTGAGKTEMIYPLIAAERARGGRVAVATPRRDVVLELLPRISAAFPQEEVAGLYGGSGRRWPTGGILVATTHQLLRYEGAFDLVVLDEMDAFPYHGDPMLAHAAHKACKPGAAFVMLSATPPPAMQRAVRRGRLACAKVPVRYHRHPLPVPALARPANLAALLAQTVARGARAFVFVPRIARLEPELDRLRKALAAVCPPGRLDATSSRDPHREDKVRRLRAGDIRILLTTTILERGVTIPKADVYVLDADHRLFDATVT